jgi:hypothetical protein
VTGARDFDLMAPGSLGIPPLQVRIWLSSAWNHSHPERGDCQEKEHDRQAKRVVVSAQVSDDGSDKKQDGAGGGGDSGLCG